MEISRPTEIEVLQEIVQPEVYMTMAFVLFLGMVLSWLMTAGYFHSIRRHTSEAIENNLMSLGGEEKVWEQFTSKPAAVPDDLHVQAIGTGSVEAFLPVQNPVPQAQVKTFKEDPPLKTAEVRELPKVEIPKVEMPLEPPKNIEPTASDAGKSINLNNISSLALKKMIQQFRNQ